MTGVIIEQITKIKNLLMFSRSYKVGVINVNISKLAKDLNKDRKTIKKYLNGEVPRKTRERIKFLDEHRDYIVEVLSDKMQSFNYIEHLFNYLKREKGIKCSRSTFSRYIRLDDELNSLFKRKKTIVLQWSLKQSRELKLSLTLKKRLIQFLTPVT